MAKTDKRNTTTENATIVIERIGSPVRRPQYQRQVLVGLGLKRNGQQVSRSDNAQTRGMIAKVPHLVRIVE